MKKIMIVLMTITFVFMFIPLRTVYATLGTVEFETPNY